MSGQREDVRRQAAEKRELIKQMLEAFPDYSNAEINKMLFVTYGSGVEGMVLANIRKGLGVGKKKRKNGAITPEDVIVLQKSSDIPTDTVEVLSEVKNYMKGMGIKRLELEDDGKVKLTMLRELETVV